MVWVCLILVTLAVARLTRLVTSDAIMLPFRRFIINRTGEESAWAYLVHCSWCTSIWISFPAAAVWAIFMLPLASWWVAIPAALAMSYVAGLLSQVEER